MSAFLVNITADYLFGKEAYSVFTNFSEFLNCVKEARITFDVIRQWILSVFKSITENPDVQSVWQGIMTLIAPVYTSVIVIAIVCCLLTAFFGKKIIGVLKFFLFFVLGFFLAIHFLAPILPPQIDVPAWIIGLVVALIAAVLARFLYTLIYLVLFAYGTYASVFFLILLNPAESYTDTKAIVCLVISVAVTVLAFVFRKYIEMTATAIFGSWAAAALFAGNIHDFSSWPLFGGKAWLGIFIATVLFACLGLFVQIKTRRRY